MTKESLEDSLTVGTQIKIGENYASKYTEFTSGEIIELVEGWFENDNGLFVEDVSCPAVFNEPQKQFHSIYHLFGNNLEDFADCQIIKQPIGNK